MAKPAVDEALTFNIEQKTENAIQEVEDTLTAQEKRRIMRRIDFRVTVVCGIIFFISLLDRGNLGFANISGMSKELQLSESNRYNIIALVFFVPYLLFQFPSTYYIRIMSVRIFLSLSCLLWGISILCCGLVRTWDQFAGMRIFLGTFEAAFFPVSIYLLSTWYLRYELQKRFAAFWFISCIANALGGPLAYGLSTMNGVAGMAGWRWIFIMEGIITITIGIASYFLLVEFPDKAHKAIWFLKEHEIQWVIDRVNADRGDAQTEPLNIRKFLAAGTDLKLWLYGMIQASNTTVNYAVSFFSPLILQQMGFTVAAAQLLSAPPYVFSGILMVVCGWLSDRQKVRGHLIAFNAILSLAGACLLLWGQNTAAKYIGLFFLAAGPMANVPAGMTYQANNIHGQWARAFSSALSVFFGGLGGIAGSLVFRAQDAPVYANGLYACMVANAIVIVIVAGLSIYFIRQNRLIMKGKTVAFGQTGFVFTL